MMNSVPELIKNTVTHRISMILVDVPVLMLASVRFRFVFTCYHRGLHSPGHPDNNDEMTDVIECSWISSHSRGSWGEIDVTSAYEEVEYVFGSLERLIWAQWTRQAECE
ncbi:hypothetical protein WN48_10087 [Eufriesea mexicana]|nr:hypothetical protein WN48_10087 [Eufriesea mexicana]